jgi:hypothetical protein
MTQLAMSGQAPEMAAPTGIRRRSHRGVGRGKKSREYLHTDKAIHDLSNNKVERKFTGNPRNKH